MKLTYKERLNLALQMLESGSYDDKEIYALIP